MQDKMNINGVEVTNAQHDNLVLADKIVTKAIEEVIPNGFKNATDEQLKKLLVNIIANIVSNHSIDSGSF